MAERAKDIAGEPQELLPDPLPADPMPLLISWSQRAAAERIEPNPDAMALATVSADGVPSARIVLAKRIDPAPGFVEFFTNYDSGKSRDLAARPVAGCVFHWDRHDHQARVEGPVTRTPDSENDAYFRTRPWARQIGAWASAQSRPIASREDLLARVVEVMTRFGLKPLDLPPPDATLDIPRPPNWGGWRLWARRVELWCGSAARIHDRAEWTRSLTQAKDGFRPGPWTSTRLQP